MAQVPAMTLLYMRAKTKREDDQRRETGDQDSFNRNPAEPKRLWIHSIV
jgi:hypothetical protein